MSLVKKKSRGMFLYIKYSKQSEEEFFFLLKYGGVKKYKKSNT